jgi:hypothetical protein
MMHEKNLEKISSWESAFAGVRDLREADWESVLRRADVALWEGLGEDAAINAQNEFCEVAMPWHLGCISSDALNSTHGDGINVDVYRLPRGMVILSRFATFELDGPTGRVIRSASVDDVVAEAYSLMDDEGYDWGEVQYESDVSDAEISPDVSTYIEGERGVREAWKRATSKE